MAKVNVTLPVLPVFPVLPVVFVVSAHSLHLSFCMHSNSRESRLCAALGLGTWHTPALSDHVDLMQVFCASHTEHQNEGIKSPL